MSNPTLKFYRKSNGDYSAELPGRDEYNAVIYRSAERGWYWESFMYANLPQSSGYAETLNEAREMVRRDFAVIADLLP